MSGNFLAVANRRVESERRAKYCGTASIKVASLRFRERFSGGTRAQEKYAESLRRIFLEERGCRREDYRHNAIAIVSKRELETALSKANISAESLIANTLPHPRLEFPLDTQLECIQGCDRLAVADDLLVGGNKRWVVDLYVDDLSDELRRLLVEDYDYQRTPTDGEIFSKIREYQGVQGDENQLFETIWLGRLAISKNRKKNFKQLSRHKTFSAAFDSMLAIPGLLDGLRLAVLHTTCSMKCDEQILLYLKCIYDWWAGICEGNLEAMRKIDSRTVEALQGRAPGAIAIDHDSLLALKRKGQIFSNFSSEEQEKMWLNVCNASQKHLIPSLYTFFEDQKLLDGVAECMRRIVDLGPRDTIQGRLKQMFTDVNQESERCVIQLADGTFGTIAGDERVRFDYGVLQLWLAALRMYKDLAADPQKKTILAKPRARGDERAEFDLASLARRFGFDSEKISRLLRKKPDRDIARRALLTSRKPTCFKYDDLERRIQQVVDIFDTATPMSTEPEAEGYLRINERTPLSRRSGIPLESDHEKDKSRLFLPLIAEKLVDGQRERDLTSFFATRSFLTAHFGEFPSINDCIVNQQREDVPMTDGGSSPLRACGDPTSWHLDKDAIRQVLHDVPDDRLEETPNEHRLQKLQESCRQENEKLEKLKVLVDQLKAEERERQKTLQHLIQKQVEEQEKLDGLLAQTSNEAQTSIHRTIVSQNDKTPEDRELGADNTLYPAPLAPQPIPSERPVTQFDFENDIPAAKEAQRNKTTEESPSVSKVHIKFMRQEEKSRNWVIADDVEVDSTDSMQVQRVAAKYMRKGFQLFDTAGNHLVARTCFSTVLANGTETILVSRVDQIRSAEMVGAAPSADLQRLPKINE